jgi:hypothetical protein
MTDAQAEDVVYVSLHFLYGRGGFDDWWSSIRPADKEGIKKEWAEYLKKEVAPAPQMG